MALWAFYIWKRTKETLFRSHRNWRCFLNGFVKNLWWLHREMVSFEDRMTRSVHVSRPNAIYVSHMHQTVFKGFVKSLSYRNGVSCVKYRIAFWRFCQKSLMFSDRNVVFWKNDKWHLWSRPVWKPDRRLHIGETHFFFFLDHF